MIEFVVKSSICLLISYVFFYLFLAKENVHVFKRFYLLSAILFSFVVPLIEIKVSNPILPVLKSNIILQQALIGGNSRISVLPEYSSFQMIWLFYIVYFSIVLILLTRFIVNINRLLRLRKNNPIKMIDKIKVVLINQITLPYSFWNYVFVNKQEYENGKMPFELLSHEFAHVRQKHSVEIILVELIQIFCWFNPLIIIYKRAIRLNHE